MKLVTLYEYRAGDTTAEILINAAHIIALRKVGNLTQVVTSSQSFTVQHDMQTVIKAIGGELK